MIIALAALMAASAHAGTLESAKDEAEIGFTAASYEAQGRGHRPPHARPPHHRPPVSRPPHHRPGHGHHHWGRWHRHPGWGHHWHDRGRRWGWDPLGRPIWWGWVVWTPASGASCRAHYMGQLSSCRTDCRVENSACESACFGDYDCLKQCRVNENYCDVSCETTYHEKVRNYCL